MKIHSGRTKGALITVNTTLLLSFLKEENGLPAKDWLLYLPLSKGGLRGLSTIIGNQGWGKSFLWLVQASTLDTSMDCVAQRSYATR